MRRTLQITLPLVIAALSGLIIWSILANKEIPEQQRFRPASPQVTVRPMQPEDFRITLRSQGEVRARTESSLIPEVRGRIVRISPNFQEGSFFEKGEVLVEIDDRDYQTELTVAEAALAQAELALLQEEARYQQARRDWERLNPGAQATELTLREPQIRQARANVASAQARVESAKLNMQRTKVTAPYAGRILTKAVDLGQFVSTGNELARIYAVDFAEVRLPLTASQVGYLNLPSIYRGSNPSIENGPGVTLTSSVGGRTFSWQGRIVRSEGSVDSRTRQLFVVAQIEDPYGETVSGRPPLKVGTFVQAEIEGTVLHNVFVVPRTVYRENSYVLVVDENSFLNTRQVGVIWENDKDIIVDQGLKAGDRLCLTDVPYALEGWQVVATLEGEETSRGALANDGPSYPDQVLNQLGEKMPSKLKEELISAKANMDWSKLGPLMRKISEWADKNGESMPPNPMFSGSPQS